MNDAVLRRLFLTAALALLTLLAIGGQYPGEGPVVLVGTPSHGLHRTDLGLIAVAGLALIAVWSR